jgi:phage N-6-adenine-methyltransferase
MSRAIGGFQVDAAADQDNHLCPAWYGPGSDLGVDALQVVRWLSPAWCNPPYLKGAAWTQWLEKFLEQRDLGATIVTLLPAKTGTDWWYDYIVKERADVLFLHGRVPFELPGSTKPSQPNHDSAIVIFSPTAAGHIAWINWKPVKEAPLEDAAVKLLTEGDDSQTA